MDTQKDTHWLFIMLKCPTKWWRGCINKRFSSHLPSPQREDSHGTQHRVSHAVVRNQKFVHKRRKSLITYGTTVCPSRHGRRLSSAESSDSIQWIPADRTFGEIKFWRQNLVTKLKTKSIIRQIKPSKIQAKAYELMRTRNCPLRLWRSMSTVPDELDDDEVHQMNAMVFWVDSMYSVCWA